MRLNWLRKVCTSPGPFATVLLDVTHDTEDAARQDELRRRGVRDALSGQGAPDAVVAAVDDTLAATAAPDGAGGVVVVADGSGIVLDAATPAPPAVPSTRWSALPDLLAVTQAVAEPVPAVVVRISEAGGEVFAPGDDDVERVAAADGDPVHKVRTGGLSDRAVQERVEETWRRTTADVAARVDDRVRATGARLLVLAGDARSRARLLDALPERSARIAAEVEHSGGGTPSDLDDTVTRAVDLLLDGERTAAFERWSQASGRGDGFAVAGLPDVLAAARAQAIDTLIIDPATATTAGVWSGPEAGQLALDRDGTAALGASDAVEVPAVAALIRAVTCSDGALIVLDHPDAVRGRDPLDDDRPDTGGVLADGALADGLGAVLRFPIGPAG